MESVTHSVPQVKQPRMERYLYPSYGSKERDAVCGVSIYQHQNQTVCIVSELPDNEGASITNRAEYVYRRIAEDYRLDPHATIFIEHYYPIFGEEEDSYDRVFFTITPEGMFAHPEWSHLNPEAVRALIGEEPPVSAPTPSPSPKGRGEEGVQS